MYKASTQERLDMILKPITPTKSKTHSKSIAVLIFDLNNFIRVLFIGYKSKTEERLVYTKSLMRIQKAMKTYKANPKPTVTKVRYINEVRTTLALIPKRSAIR